MPLPKPPKKPADKLKSLPATASIAAHTTDTLTSTSTSSNALDASANLVLNAPMLRPEMSSNLGKTKAAAMAAMAAKASNNLHASTPETAIKGRIKTTHSTDTQPLQTHTAASAAVQKLYVLDTNVLLHDPSSLFRFDEHSIFLPMMVLEELDNHKKGTTEVARHARQISRTLDRLVNQADGNITTGIPLRATDDADFSGYLYFQTDIANSNVPKGLAAGVPDHLILGELERLAKARAPQPVVLVSKDINIRLKASVLGLNAQDYLNDNITQDSDNLHTGWIDTRAWSQAQLAHLNLVEQWQENGIAHIKLGGTACSTLPMNSFVLLPDTLNKENFFELGARVIDTTGKQVTLKAVRDFTLPKHAVWGVQARNLEQNAALNLLTNPEIDCVSLLGQAGTGKTLLTLAAGLAQVLDKRIYSDIILTRATVSVGDDIGFLPGTEEEKMAPWMGAVEDNLEVLLGNSKTGTGIGGAWGQQASIELIRSRIKIKSMAFMRGRTFQNKFVIVDEAQNLTPKQMKTLITRAGPGTKFVCLGNLAQIDTPYLTEHSSGLAYMIDRFQGWPHGGHVTLARGERSRLAEFATEVL
jgi:PhoH-like ATPase